ncbi:MAG: nucleotidyltransferase domain-containing protein [Dysgonamonadaceae bacterium]|jgi:predicted nucleotidyltransferase|nr:nucleotidyltransferase domain-containing protein [Dysgonamonadaceae bacterium]
MLTEEQKNIIIETMLPYDPEMIGVFGSYARNEETNESDIDILYRLETAVGLFNLVRIKDDLESKLNTKVDLVSEQCVHNKLKPQIMNDLKIIYENRR